MKLPQEMPNTNTEMQHEAFWVVRFAPFRTPWKEVVKRGIFTPRGIKSAEARKHLLAMRKGDPVFFYETHDTKAVVGCMEVSKEAYPDPTIAEGAWVTCDFIPVRSLRRPVGLSQIKDDPLLRDTALVKQPRLSVVHLGRPAFQAIERLGSDKSAAGMNTREESRNEEAT
ncbi:MAG: EVE domain-containing protein [Sumerlaeia bacterium]